MRRLSCALALIVITAGCATWSPPWTPETVAPPATPPAPLEPAPPLPSVTQPVAVPDTVAASDPNAPAVPLTLESALLTALVNNRGLEVARFGPDIAETLIPQARAAFDPLLSASLTASDDERALTSAAADARRVTRTAGDAVEDTVTLLGQVQQLITSLRGDDGELDIESRTGTLAVSQRLPTGTQFSVAGNAGTADSNLTGDQDSDGVSVQVAQPLLEDAGLAVNLVALRQARNRAAQGEAVFREQVLDFVATVDLTYWDLTLAEEVLEIRRFAVDLAAEQLRRNEELFRVGRIIEGDVMAARAERASREASLADAEADLQQQTLAMIQLINPRVAEQWGLRFDPLEPPPVQPVAVDPQASEALALAYRPDVAQARLDLANANLDSLQARNELLPRLDVVGAYASNDVRGNAISASGFSSGSGSTTDSESYRVGIQFEQPLFNRGEKARYRRAQLIEKQTAASIANLEQTVARQVRQAAVAVHQQWQRIQATAEALASRTEQLRVAQGRYDAGRITNLDLLLVQRDLIQARVDDVTARLRYIEALTRLHAAEGTLLERRGVSLDLAREQK